MLPGPSRSLALGTVTYAETGSPVLSAFMMFGGPLVRLAASWFLLSLADLWRPRTALMVACGAIAGGNALQAIPHLPIALRLVFLILPWILLSATSGTMVALISDVVPEGAFVFARSTSNIARRCHADRRVQPGRGPPAPVQRRLSCSWDPPLTDLLVVLLCRVGLGDHPPRARGRAVRRSRAVNRLLLGSRVLRPVYLALWVPNGLVVGCEALILPYAGSRAGFMFSATALGMLAGDVGMGRFVPASRRDRLVEPARLLLAAPYLFFFLQPSLGPAFLLAAVASVGVCASLPLQERLVTWTSPDIRGQVLGLYTVGMSSMQGVGALLAGGLASLLGGDAHAAGVAIGVAATASFLVTLALIPGRAGAARTGRSRWCSLGVSDVDPSASEVAGPVARPSSEVPLPQEIGNGADVRAYLRERVFYLSARTPTEGIDQP